MRKFLTGVVVTLVAFAVGALLVVNLGWYPIGADNPPSSLERAMANRAVDAYVGRHAPTGDNPIQPTVANLTAGAQDYQQHCALCHGGNAQHPSPMRDHFNPPVPAIAAHIPDDPDANLFWVTKHGIRMTGMPAWGGILSDNQIWTIIAFIKHANQLPPEVQTAWHDAATSATAPLVAPLASAPSAADQKKLTPEQRELRQAEEEVRQHGPQPKPHTPPKRK